MTRRRQRTGRVKVDFSVIEKYAAQLLPELLPSSVHDDLSLTKGSSLHRRKDGSYTLCLIWKAGENLTLHSTVRGLRLGAPA